MIAKILSANDVGSTKSHQAGILIPKNEEILSFFPQLDKALKNPRKEMNVWDNDGNFFQFYFIYYNNKFFGGTRNEYRLTCISKYIKKHGLRQGDIIRLRNEGSNYYISHEKASNRMLSDYLVLSNDWMTINLK
jgi:hypothetical protein